MYAVFLFILVLVAVLIGRVAAAFSAACREEEADLAAKAADAGVSPEEYRRRQAQIEAEWARGAAK